MKKYLLSFIFASFFIVGLFTVSGTQNCANAMTYGPEAICPNPAANGKKVKDFYPGQSISSSDIHVVFIGSSNVSGIRFAASAGAESCSTVQCLSRIGGGITGAMINGGEVGTSIVTLGCGGANGGCNDTATVTGGAYDEITGMNCTWFTSDNGAPGSFSPGNTTTVQLANGTPTSVYFQLICTPIPHTPTNTLTPTKSPTPTPTKSPTPTLTPTKSPTPTPTVTVPPNSTSTPTTPPVCPVPATPVVTVNCPTCAPN